MPLSSVQTTAVKLTLVAIRVLRVVRVLAVMSHKAGTNGPASHPLADELPEEAQHHDVEDEYAGEVLAVEPPEEGQEEAAPKGACTATYS